MGKILIVLAAILVLLLLFAIFNNVNKSDNANMKQALETQQKEKGTNKKSHKRWQMRIQL